MSRLFRALTMLVILGSCGSREYSAPRELDNACSIVAQHPEYLRAFRAAERRYGVEPHILMAMIYQESKFIGNSRTPHQFALGIIPIGRQSSAYGYSQALDGTWEEYLNGPGNRRAKRDDIDDAADFMGWYMTQTVAETGVPINSAREQYLAYHEGRSGYNRGSYNSKSWLLRVSQEVSDRADLYGAQLRSCNRA